jgi:hypothetical protein
MANAFALLSIKRLLWQVSRDVFVIAVRGVVGTVIEDWLIGYTAVPLTTLAFEIYPVTAVAE